jgi:hypothetical protein
MARSPCFSTAGADGDPMNKLFKILMAMAWLAVPVAGHAQQRPLVTEDPETIGANRILLEGGLELDTDQTTAYGLRGDIAHIATFGVSVGLSPNTEVQIDGGLLQRLNVTERRPNNPLFLPTSLVAGNRPSGFEDLVVATKIRFASETDGRPAFGVRFGAKVPTADADKGIGLGTTDLFASFLVAKTVQSVRTVGNVGLFVLGNPEVAQEPATALGFGVSVARAVTNAFEVVGEVNGRLTPFDKIVPAGLESRGVFRLAGRYTYAMLRLDFGIIAGITNRDPSFGISAGATYVISR